REPERLEPPRRAPRDLEHTCAIPGVTVHLHHFAQELQRLRKTSFENRAQPLLNHARCKLCAVRSSLQSRSRRRRRSTRVVGRRDSPRIRRRSRIWWISPMRKSFAAHREPRVTIGTVRVAYSGWVVVI